MTTYSRRHQSSLTQIWEPQIPWTCTSFTWDLWHPKCDTAVHLLWDFRLPARCRWALNVSVSICWWYIRSYMCLHR